MATVRMHDRQIDTSPRLVRRLLAEQFPHWSAEPVVPGPYRAGVTEQKCPRCQGRRDPAAFTDPSGRRHKTCQTCRDRSRRENRERRERINAAGVRADNLRTKYGIAVQEYDALRRRQDYRCAAI